MKSSMLLIAASLVCAGVSDTVAKDQFTDVFTADKADLASVGTNNFFILAPGYQLVLEGKESGKPTVLTITVLKETRVVDGVETRIVEEKETVSGELVEVSRNYFAISTRTSDVFYFGEEVDIYKNGKIVSHEGAWLAGVNGARFGLMMPGSPLLGARYYQEVAPGLAMDRAEICSLSAEVKTPAGSFANCLETRESSAVESGRETKFYAPGIGIVMDGALKLLRRGFAGQG